MAETVPAGDLPSLAWLLEVADRSFRIGLNSLAIDASISRSPRFAERQSQAWQAISARRPDSSVAGDLFRGIADYSAPSLQPGRRPRSIEDYEQLFRVIGLPRGARGYSRDSVFAAMRTSGPNPLMLRRLEQPLSNLPITDAQFRQVLRGDSPSAALTSGRLYVADYGLLAALERDPAVTPKKFLYAPIALFAERPDSGRLTPVAIQLQQSLGQGDRVYLADSSTDWLIAKSIVQMADGNFHEAVSHLGRTHLFIEPFVVATGRKLPESHPVRRLLWPHFEGTLFINMAAVKLLLAAGGPVDHLLNGTIESILELAATGVQSYPFNDAFLPRMIKARGLDKLKDYPYRDDALLYWDAIHTWAAGYLHAVYPAGDLGVAGDSALRAWYEDIVSPDGGRVAGFGENSGPIRSLAYLTDALTMIIFTASVQHAAVNFPQYDQMSYAPSMPLAAYSRFPRPGSTGPAGLQDYLDVLPPLDRALEQLNILYLLGTIHYTKLGDYGANYFSASINRGPLAVFQSQLRDIEATIRLRNLSRTPYEVLLPGAIPQSINI